MANTPSSDLDDRVAYAAERIGRLIRRRHADGLQDRLTVFVTSDGGIHTLPVDNPNNLPRVPLASVIGVYDHTAAVEDLWTDIEWFMTTHQDPAQVQDGVFVGRLFYAS